MAKYVYVTGKIEGMNKTDVQRIVESRGFIFDAFSKKTDLLVFGERAGQKKLDKAKEDGIRVISWDEFLKENPT
jgi:NAD-dependent DNA ligase